ncbi:MAG: argininosuccinate synthase [Candidatus Micrarchaeia archaeon]
MDADKLRRIREEFAREHADVKRAVVAFTGGLDTTVAVALLQEMGVKVITVTLDIGQTRDLRDVAKKAEAMGVERHYTIFARDEFINEYVARAIKANCLWEGELNSEGLSRPLLCKYLAEVAEKEGAQAVVHGSTGIGNDQIRFDASLRAIAPHLKVLAPIRDWDLKREEELAYAKERKLAKLKEKPRPYSTDENIWGRSIKSGPLEHPELEVPEDAFAWTVAPEKAPPKPQFIELSFHMGIPRVLRVLDEKKRVVEETGNVIERLNKLAGAHGVGRMDHMEDKAVGLKIREVYEAPAAYCIITAHKELEKLVLTKRELDTKAGIDYTWNRLVDEGAWYTPLREALDAFIDKTQERVSGSVMLKLFKGNASVVAKKSKYALYDAFLSSATAEGIFSRRDARAFAKLYGLQDIIAYWIRKSA